MAMDDHTPESAARSVVAACTDCEVCRYMLDTECPVFEALYRRHDQAWEQGRPLASSELRDILDRCHYCTLCGCPDIRAGIIEAKARYAARDGRALGSRLMADVAGAARFCGRFPQLVNRLLAGGKAAMFVKRLAGIHPSRRLPTFPRASFDAWARRQGLTRKPASGSASRVAYFAGCSGRYLFPEVPRAVVTVLKRLGAAVYFPDQQCCGMPTLLEGDRRKTLAFAAANLDRLAALVDEGFTIVCSCPTCGYVLKKLLKERACYADAYQAAVGAEPEVMKIPIEDPSPDGTGPRFRTIRKSTYGAILRDDGYFAASDPLKRIRVAENTMDAGEYLLRLARRAGRAANLVLPRRMVYFAPCHQREQAIGRPYATLLGDLGAAPAAVIDGAYDCCGMGGLMGYKRSFHDIAVRLGAPVMRKITGLRADLIVTECLSCRLQFRHLGNLPVAHPLEVAAALLEVPRPGGKAR